MLYRTVNVANYDEACCELRALINTAEDQNILFALLAGEVSTSQVSALLSDRSQLTS